jgi:anhydro-N-acetylmuramic acid kinase
MAKRRGHDGPIWALGTMSGTSLDGVDAAMVLTDGHTITEFGPHAYRPYTATERTTIRAAFGRWPGDAGVAEAAEVVETAHAEVLTRFNGADLIGFHGQTLAHDPANGRTNQTGNGALLAELLKTPVVWDFRSTDVALGGQGAPLAPFFHFACAKWIGADAPLAMLNLGGVGNITWIDPRLANPDSEGALLAFDTGPANAPVNDLMQTRLGLAQDEGGQLASTGRIDEALVKAFLALPFFHKLPPKSLDRNDFQKFIRKTHRLNNADAAATLTAIAAASVAQSTEHFPSAITKLLVTGGGRHNATLMTALQSRLTCPVVPIESANLNGDMLEAQAFAYLAVRVMRGLPTSCPTTTGIAASVGGGQISRP